MKTNHVKRVLVDRNEYGIDIYDASTDESFSKAAIHVLQERINQGYLVPNSYYTDEEAVKLKPQFTIEQIVEMKPNTAVRQAAEAEYEKYRDFIGEKNRQEKLQNQIKFALENKDGKAAFGVLAYILNSGRTRDVVEVVIVKEVSEL